MSENIFAYTAPGGSYPGYVSINRLDNGDVRVSVRAAPTTLDHGGGFGSHVVEGVLAEFDIPADEWAKFGQ